MRLRGVTAENFRAFQYAKIALPDAGLVLIAGANNGGKTALLSALDIVAGDSGDTTSLQHDSGEFDPVVTAAFSLSEAERVSVLTGVAPNHQLRRLDEAFETLEFRFVQDQEVLRATGDSGLGLTEIRGSWPGHGMELLAKRSHPPGGGAVGIEVLAQLRGNTTDQPNMAQERWGGSPGWLDYAMRIRQEMIPLAELLNGWRSRYYHFQALRTGTKRIQELVPVKKLDPTGADLAGVMLFLMSDRRALFKELGELVADIG